MHILLATLHITASVSQCLQQCEIKIKSNTVSQKFVAIYFGGLAVYILPILIKVGRCGLLKDDARASSLSEEELKESNASVKHLLESKTSTLRQVLRRYNKQTYKIFVRTCPTTEPHH